VTLLPPIGGEFAAGIAELEHLAAELRLPKEADSLRPWQLPHNELVRVIDHLAKLIVGYRTIQFHGVPMALVLVIAGTNRSVPDAQVHRNIRIALEVDAALIPVERHEGEHAASDLEHGNAFSEWMVLDSFGKASADCQDLVSGHARNG